MTLIYDANLVNFINISLNDVIWRINIFKYNFYLMDSENFKSVTYKEKFSLFD